MYIVQSNLFRLHAMLLMLNSTSSTSTTQWSGGAFSINSMKVHIWIDQQRGNMLMFLSARGDFAVSDCDCLMLRSGELG